MVGGNAMKRAALLYVTITTALLAVNAYAGGTDKVTGEYTRGNCPDFACEPPGEELGFVYHRMIIAHESSNKKPQKGFLLSWRDDGYWYEIDLSDSTNSCVHVFQDGKARIGGVVTDGSPGAPPIGRYFGVLMEDGGQPAYWADRSVTIRMSSLYVGEEGWEDVRSFFLNWCETGSTEDPPVGFNDAWKGIVFEGNFKVHNSPRDGD
jgi:hypothetical protein